MKATRRSSRHSVSSVVTSIPCREHPQSVGGEGREGGEDVWGAAGLAVGKVGEGG